MGRLDTDKDNLSFVHSHGHCLHCHPEVRAQTERVLLVESMEISGHRSRGPASRGAGRGDSLAYQVWLTEVLHPVSVWIVKMTSRGAQWTAALGLSDFAMTKHMCGDFRLQKIKGNLQMPPNRNAGKIEKKASTPQTTEEAEGQPLHTCCSILSRIACFTEKLTKHSISIIRLAQTRSNDIEPLFASKWSKHENLVFNTATAVVHVENLCTDIEGWNDEIAFDFMFRENFW